MARELRHEIGKRAAFEDPTVEAYLNVVRTAAALSSAMGPVLRGQGLTESKYNVLRILRGHGPPGVPCQTIHEEMVVPSPDVTRLVDGLERAGLASRTRSEDDRRSVLVRITARGSAALRSLDEPVLERHRALLGRLTRAELEELSRLLVKARESAAGA